MLVGLVEHRVLIPHRIDTWVVDSLLAGLKENLRWYQSINSEELILESLNPRFVQALRGAQGEFLMVSKHQL